MLDITKASIARLNGEIDQIEAVMLYLDPHDPIEAIARDKVLNRLEEIEQQLGHIWGERIAERRCQFRVISSRASV